jgi:hypothetical protein
MECRKVAQAVSKPTQVKQWSAVTTIGWFDIDKDITVSWAKLWFAGRAVSFRPSWARTFR